MNNKTMIDETHLADSALERSAVVHLVQEVSEQVGGHQAGLRTQAAHRHHGRGRGQGVRHLSGGVVRGGVRAHRTRGHLMPTGN